MHARRFIAHFFCSWLIVCAGWAQSAPPSAKGKKDEVQPYVIFSRATLEASKAVNVEEFLAQRTTVNASAKKSQPLVLIDGRRLAPDSASADKLHPASLKDVQLPTVERIEVMPATDSAIYGGAASSGVINVILRRDAAAMNPKR